MTTGKRPSRERASWGPSPLFLAIALALVAGTIAWWATATADPGAAPVAAVGASAPTVAPASAVRIEFAAASAPDASVAVARAPSPMPAASAASPRIARMRDPDGDQTPDLADYINEGERPTMGEVIARLNAAGVYTGLGAFSPPGTKPVLVGLAVPEDFALPPGYVRHYQATDDGQRVEAILRFAPDVQLFDAARRPIAMPKDRVVPPELAPPGLPLRRIVIPAPMEPSGS